MTNEPVCSQCGRKLGVGFYYHCHRCGAYYCYEHAPKKCDHLAMQPSTRTRCLKGGEARGTGVSPGTSRFKKQIGDREPTAKHKHDEEKIREVREEMLQALKRLEKIDELNEKEAS